MSFTKDELQSFNTILEQKLMQQRRELERGFDQRLHLFKRELDQRLAFTQQEFVRTLSQSLSEQYRKLKVIVSQHIDMQQVRTSVPVVGDVEFKQQLEDIVEHALDTQLISFDQLINERFTIVNEVPTSSIETSPDFAGMELHTEIPLDDLAEVVNKTLDERFSSLDEVLKSSITGIEKYLATRLDGLGEELPAQPNSTRGERVVETQSPDGTITMMHDVFTSIERLERIIESMQVAMTSNHALLSNRLYHHQQLPLERAHSGMQEDSTQNANATKSQFSWSREQNKQ